MEKADAGGFSAAAYYFGRMLHKELERAGRPDRHVLGRHAGRVLDQPQGAGSQPGAEDLDGQGESSCLYNGMIAPLIPYAIRGAIWYQGESNVGRAYQYRTLFPAMIAQLAEPTGARATSPSASCRLRPSATAEGCTANCAELWEAQLMTLKTMPNTGMAVTMDIGDVKDIHPKNKQDVGRRLALWALAKVYGRDVVYSGPIYKSMAVEGNKIRLQFDHVGGGLIAARRQAAGGLHDRRGRSEVRAGRGRDRRRLDRRPQRAGRRAGGGALRLARDATPNLVNKEGLPASPFRTDEWKEEGQ